MTFGSAGLNISGRPNQCAKTGLRRFTLTSDQMHDNRKDGRSFREFVFAHRTFILIILAAALAWRIILVIGFPHGAVDEIRYTAPAVNMLAGHGFSADVREPFVPSDHTVPLYPLFLSAVYGVVGEHNAAVRIFQSVVDLITCLLIAFIAFNLAPRALEKPAALASLIIYGFISWFTVSWTRYILTETLAIFLTVLAIAVAIWAMRGSRWRWLVVGAICGLALLARADSVVLAGAFVSFLVWQMIRERSMKEIIDIGFFCFALLVVLSPWVVRNYVALGKFQPLANPYGKPHGEYVPTGYMLWIRTWLKSDVEYHQADLVFHPGNRDFDPRRLPADTFDSVEERDEVLSLIDKYNQTGEMTADIRDQFLAIANARIKRHPLRFYLWLPLQRATCMWLTGFSTSNALRLIARVALVLPILIGGVLGFMFWVRQSPLTPLLLLIVLTRTIFFSYLSAEARYVAEAYPVMIASCAVTTVAVWYYLRTSWVKSSA